jgi:subtilisin family serine protease
VVLGILALLLILLPVVNAEKVIVVLKDQPKSRILSQIKHESLIKQRDLVNTLKLYKAMGKVREIKQLWLINAIAVDATPDVIEEIKKRRDVAKVIPDYKVKLLDANLTVTAEQNVEWNIELIEADKVWALGINGSGIRVAVVDTGIAQHPDLKGKIVAWKDFVNGKPEPYDDNGHGTHVAGIIAGNTTGVAPGVSLIGVKVFYAEGYADLSTIIDGFWWAVENASADIISFSGGFLPYDEINGSATVNGVNEHNIPVRESYYIDSNETAYKPASIVVCLSSNDLTVSLISPNNESVPLERLPNSHNCWVYTADDYPLQSGIWKLKVESNVKKQYVYNIYVVYPSDGNSTLDQVVNELVDLGVVVVCAAGNEGYYGFRTINSPASAKKAIAVGATSYNSSTIAGFSSKGPVGFGDNITVKPDVVAPGVSIWSTVPPDGYTLMSGTSMATPHVSGVVALMLQANPNLTPEDVKEILAKTAVDLGEEGKDNVYGYGLVNAYYAVLNATVRGDLNYNGVVDVGDVSIVAGMIVGKVKPDLRADFNENGRIDVGDLARIAYYVLGLIDAL